MRAVAALVVVALALAARAEERPPDVAAARADAIAKMVGLVPLLARLDQAPSGGGLEATVARFELRDDTLAELQRVSELIDATLARIDQEQAASATAQAFVESNYTRAVTGWNIAAVLVGNSLSIAGTALQFDGTSQGYAGDGIILGGAALATAFSLVALTRKSAARMPHAIDTNFLAPLVGRTPTPDSRLPEPVWRYLDTPLPGEPASLRRQLVDLWTRRGSLLRGDSPQARHKIDLLAEPITRRTVVPADVLDERADMLADLRARVAAMYVDVHALGRLVRARAAAR